MNPSGLLQLHPATVIDGVKASIYGTLSCANNITLNHASTLELGATGKTQGNLDGDYFLPGSLLLINGTLQCIADNGLGIAIFAESISVQTSSRITTTNLTLFRMPTQCKMAAQQLKYALVV